MQFHTNILIASYVYLIVSKHSVNSLSLHLQRLLCSLILFLQLEFDPFKFLGSNFE